MDGKFSANRLKLIRAAPALGRNITLQTRTIIKREWGMKTPTVQKLENYVVILTPNSGTPLRIPLTRWAHVACGVELLRADGSSGALILKKYRFLQNSPIQISAWLATFPKTFSKTSSEGLASDLVAFSTRLPQITDYKCPRYFQTVISFFKSSGGFSAEIDEVK